MNRLTSILIFVVGMATSVILAVLFHMDAVQGSIFAFLMGMIFGGWSFLHWTTWNVVALSGRREERRP